MGAFSRGDQFPPQKDIPRLAKYKRTRAIFDNDLYKVFYRASEVLKDTPMAPQLEKLYIAVGLMDAITTKPADMLVGERPTFDSGEPGKNEVSKALSRIVEENDLVQLIHELTIGAGIRGDSWIKVRYGYRQDMSAIPFGYDVPDVIMEPVIEHVNADYVFPETTATNVKRFKATNICTVEWVASKKEEVPYLNVERHVPGYIIYERYKLEQVSVISDFGADIDVFNIVSIEETGRERDVIPTGASYPLVFHVPYKSLDNQWEGVGGIEKLESILAAIQDRLVMIDYVIHKNGNPTAYGPDLEGGGSSGGVAIGGAYLPLTKDDPTPGYMSIGGALDAAFRELDYLLGLVYQISETPDFLFGTSVIGDGNKTGGTSHTSNAAIKSRFLPILSKVKRIRAHVDKAIRDALWVAQIVENYANEEVEEFKSYKPVYPVISWKDGIPKDEKEEAEVYSLRTNGKPTLDQKSAIRRSDDVDDLQAEEILKRIEEDEKTANGFVEPSIFNEES